MPKPMKMNSHYYQAFDADYSRDVPGEGYRGWQQKELTFDREHTALVVMHAWDCGTPEQFPGWYRCVEYIPRANKIAKTVFPPILKAARETGFRMYHVVGGGDVYKPMPGFKRAVSLAQPRPHREALKVEDPLMTAVHEFRRRNVFVGVHNENDVNRGFQDLQFIPEAKPQGDEGIAEDGPQLFGLCEADQVNHLIYIGFAINWCLFLSPGGMFDMNKHGIMCSTIRQATTAVENKEMARTEGCKEAGLWRVALGYGFVFDDFEFIRALRAK